MTDYVSRILEFIKEESPECYSQFPDWEDRIKKHIDFNTVCVLWDGDTIAGITTFNVKEHLLGVFHSIVGKGYRNKHILREMLKEIKLRYPSIEDICFYRRLKYKDRQMKRLSVDRFLKGE